MNDSLPRYNPGNGQVKTITTETSAPSDAEIALLATLPAGELKDLCKRICGARWGEIGLLSEDQAYEAVCLKMLHGGLTQPDMYKALPALKEWADRRKGKAAQSIALAVEVNPLSKMTTERLLALEASMSRALGEDAVIVLQDLIP